MDDGDSDDEETRKKRRKKQWDEEEKTRNEANAEEYMRLSKIVWKEVRIYNIARQIKGSKTN